MGVFPEPKPVKFGSYILLDRINVGGMAEVFRGKMQGVEGFERLVALKRILPNIAKDEDFIEMFIDEAKLAVQLQHANIAQIYDLGEVEAMYYIALEYISGADLRTMWDRARQRNRLLPIAMSCYIMQKTCEGLDAAHRKKDDTGTDIGLVHRDVSPQNVLISFEGEVKIIDFGIAKASNKVSKTQAGVLKGKFGYMSPEQVRGVDLDNRSDIFACGVVLYELLVGDRLFLGESDFSTLEKVRNVELVPPTRLNKSLSPHLERIVMKALSKSREDRYRWASEMAEDLQRYLFATNQPFARTDLQRYMQQHFKDEIKKEKERLQKYKAITFDQFKDEEPKPDPATDVGHPQPNLPAAEPQTEVAAGIQAQAGFGQVPPGHPVVTPGGQPGQPPTIGMQQALLSPSGTVNQMVPQQPVPPPKPRLPAWAAALIGGLVAIIVITGGVILYRATAKPDPGAISIEVSPTNAEIRVNAELVSNNSPFTLDNLEPNTYVLTVSAKGYQESIRAVKVVAGESRMEKFVLKAIVGTASIILRTDPPGLHIWIDGKDTGFKTPATISGLNAGTRKVMLKREDESIVHRFHIPLQEGSAEGVELDTKKLPAVLDVTSTPSGGVVKVNGQVKGPTPVTASGLRPGRTVVVEVEKQGCKTHSSKVTLRRATIITLDAVLKCKEGALDKEKGTGRLNVSATVMAHILVDGTKVGTTPAYGLKVPAGKRKVKLVPVTGDKKPWETEVEVVAGAAPVSIEHMF